MPSKTEPTSAVHTIEVRDPNSGEVVGTVPEQSAAEVEAAVARARVAATRWAALDHDARRGELVAFRRGLAQAARELSELIHRENGKPRIDAVQEVMLALSHLSHAAGRAKKALETRSVSAGLLANFKATISYHPLGVVGVIGPWNYPIFTPFGSIAYALAAGNTVVFKPSELTPLVARRIAEIADATISVPDVLQVVTGRGVTGAALAKAEVDKIAFTGSAATGRRVMAAAAERLTPVLMELGGKDAMIVLPDADVERAAEAAVYGAMTNAGQACVSVERAYVHATIFDRFVDRAVHEAEAIVVGGGDDAHIGAITLPGQVDIIRRHLEDAVAKGAKVLCGGPDAIEANRVPPTVLVDVTPEMEILREETFGPVLPIVRVEDGEEALRLANDSKYGLGASVFGKSGARELAERIQSGMAAVNAVIAFSAIPNLPFGGIRESGFGRIHGDEGLREFTRTKAVAEQRFSLPMDMMSFKQPADTAERLLKIIDKAYGGRLLDTAADLLRRFRIL